MASVTHSSLVAEAMLLMKRRDDAIAELRAIEEKLIALGAGKYTDGGNIAQVIGEVPASKGSDSYSLGSKDDEDRAKEIAGDDFRKAFDFVSYYKCCAGFSEVVPKIFTPAKATKLLDLCFVPGGVISGKRAHVRWPNK